MSSKIIKITISCVLAAALLCGLVCAVFITTTPIVVHAESLETTANVAMSKPVTKEVSTFDYGDDVVTQTISTTQTANGVECEFQLQSRARGVFCTIAVSVQGDRKGTVTGIAKNTFTLGTSTIPVWIVLWSASSKTGIDLNVSPEGFNHTDDLNIFKSVECSNGTGGQAKYWQAHAYWNFDNNGWEHGFTPVAYYDANAVYDKNK